MSSYIYAKYLWVDGSKPTPLLRGKTRVLSYEKSLDLKDFPVWNFDGSSTNQAKTGDSDCELRPCYFVIDPLRGPGGKHVIVLCEVYDKDGNPHKTNMRRGLAELMDRGGKDIDAYIGFEQEYTLFKGFRPLGWPETGEIPEAQGPFYCGIGASRVFGRELVEKHMNICNQAGLIFFGINAEVMPGQWEYQLGYRGNNREAADPLTISDQLWIARYFLDRIAEEFNIIVSLENKPMKGDWNGAGMHTNFSTRDMRDPEKGQETINKFISYLKEYHLEHIQKYGYKLEERLTGLHETSSINKFSYGNSDRSASVRIPLTTAKSGYGYIEDRRPGANADPYVVSKILMEGVC